MREPGKVIQHPLITEKALNARAGNVYVFKVHPKSTKDGIKQAVEKLFNVKVLSVNTINVLGKVRGRLMRRFGQTSTWKKAFVKIAAGEKIKLLEENS